MHHGRNTTNVEPSSFSELKIVMECSTEFPNESFENCVSKKKEG